MENDDFEEGEILDSEEDEKNEKEEGASDKEPELDPLNTYNVITRPSNDSSNVYRQQKITINDDSEEDDDSAVSSDEDTDLWKLKKSKFFSNRSDKVDVKLSDVIKSPIRPSKNGKPENGTSATRNISFGEEEKRKKQNNVWGSVLVEQSLSQTMGTIGVERKDHVLNSYRNVEAYDYLKAHEDDRPFNEDSNDKQESHDPFQMVIDDKKSSNKRQKRQHSRQGDRHGGKRQKRYRTCNENDSDEVVVETIVENLHEEKSYLIEQILRVIGKKKAVELMYATEDIEEDGGMKTFDGRRRRTPGGVFIQLIKQDADVTKEMVDEIFAEEQKKYKKEQSKIHKQRQKEKRKLRKMLPQNRLLQGTERKEKILKSESGTDEEDNSIEMGDNANKMNTSVKSNDDDFLNREEEELEVIIGDS